MEQSQIEPSQEESLSDDELLTQLGFSKDEIIWALYLRQWYQGGGSDRIEIIRRMEFIKLLVKNGKMQS